MTFPIKDNINCEDIFQVVSKSYKEYQALHYSESSAGKSGCSARLFGRHGGEQGTKQLEELLKSANEQFSPSSFLVFLSNYFNGRFNGGWEDNISLKPILLKNLIATFGDLEPPVPHTKEGTHRYLKELHKHLQRSMSLEEKKAYERTKIGLLQKSCWEPQYGRILTGLGKGRWQDTSNVFRLESAINLINSFSSDITRKHNIQWIFKLPQQASSLSKVMQRLREMNQLTEDNFDKLMKNATVFGRNDLEFIFEQFSDNTLFCFDDWLLLVQNVMPDVAAEKIIEHIFDNLNVDNRDHGKIKAAIETLECIKSVVIDHFRQLYELSKKSHDLRSEDTISSSTLNKIWGNIKDEVMRKSQEYRNLFSTDEEFILFICTSLVSFDLTNENRDAIFYLPTLEHGKSRLQQAGSLTESNAQALEQDPKHAWRLGRGLATLIQGGLYQEIKYKKFIQDHAEYAPSLARAMVGLHQAHLLNDENLETLSQNASMAKNLNFSEGYDVTTVFNGWVSECNAQTARLGH